MRSFWLFQKSPAGLSRRRTVLFIAWNVAFLLCSAVCLGGVSLLYAYGGYCPDLFYDYFHHPLLLVLTIAPVVGLEVLLWCLTGRIRTDREGRCAHRDSCSDTCGTPSYPPVQDVR